MSYLSQRLTGVTLVLIYLRGYFSPIESHECRSRFIKTDKTDSLYVDCVDKNLLSIPQDINENVEVFNISKNPALNQLKEDAFKKYDDIVELTMKELNITNIAPNIFNPFQSLKILDISSTCFSEPIPKLPVSLTHIIANSIYTHCSKVSLPVMTELLHLVGFVCKDNNLNDLPSLHINAPIEFIDLSKNPMRNFMYTDIAPFCTLSHLNLFGSDLSLNSYHEQCCELKKWGEEHAITVVLSCDKQCGDIKFDEKAIEAYNDCVSTPGSVFLSRDYIIFEVLIFGAFCLTIGYLVYRHFNSDAVKKRKEEKNRQQMAASQLAQKEEFPEGREEVGEEFIMYEDKTTTSEGLLSD